MAITHDIEKLIMRLSPAAICDDCIADRLEIAERWRASRQARELAGTHGFERRKDICGLCNGTKLVMRQV